MAQLNGIRWKRERRRKKALAWKLLHYSLFFLQLLGFVLLKTNHALGETAEETIFLMWIWCLESWRREFDTVKAGKCAVASYGRRRSGGDGGVIRISDMLCKFFFATKKTKQGYLGCTGEVSVIETRVWIIEQRQNRSASCHFVSVFG